MQEACVKCSNAYAEFNILADLSISKSSRLHWTPADSCRVSDGAKTNEATVLRNLVRQFRVEKCSKDEQQGEPWRTLFLK